MGSFHTNSRLQASRNAAFACAFSAGQILRAVAGERVEFGLKCAVQNAQLATGVKQASLMRIITQITEQVSLDT
jgi:hypothetical protein